MTLRRTLSITMAAAAIGCLAVSSRLVAATTNPIITYTASGTFASTPISGEDQLQLAGEPFTVSIAVSATTPPSQQGTSCCVYNKLTLKGVVHAGILGTTPEDIASSEATIIQSVDPGVKNLFTMEAPIKVVDFIVTIKAVIVLPANALSKPLLYPFGSVTLAPTNATVTVAYNGENTVLAIQSGTLTATLPKNSTKAAVVLHSNGGETIIHHADGTESVRSIGSAPVDLGMAADTARLKFYASGVSAALDVHVQIGGEEVPVLYAGASGYFHGLDELIVEVPRTLAGRGATEVSLTADGQTAEPVHIQIQ
ncbi:MAG TPA: hypothetical protein VMR62_00940 [Bryobacteraceae bacterium]|jgi:uncharacterized protein (TIGR03437 family)|nr:hypothetical protein [Bryobacteraceae bacterium]